MDTSFYSELEMVGLAVHFVLKANYKDKKSIFNGQEILVKRGQFITGRKVLAKEFKTPGTTIWRKVEILKNVGFLDIKSNNRFSIITIVKYDKYQDKDIKMDSTLDNRWTTDGQQMGTSKEYKKEKNDNTGKEAKILLNYFFSKYKEERKQSYITNIPKDMKLLKNILKSLSIQTIKVCIDNFFNSSDKFIKSTDYSVGVFFSQINKLQKVDTEFIPKEL